MLIVSYLRSALLYVIKVVLKNRFELLIGTLSKLYRREQYLYSRVRVVLGLKTKHSL